MKIVIIVIKDFIAKNATLLFVKANGSVVLKLGYRTPRGT